MNKFIFIVLIIGWIVILPSVILIIRKGLKEIKYNKKIAKEVLKGKSDLYGQGLLF